MSLYVSGATAPAEILRCYSGDFSATMVALQVFSARNVGMALDVLQGLGFCPPSGFY